LVGDNRELRYDEETIQKLAKIKQEPVTTVEGRAMAEKIGAVGYFECSAMLNEGVNEVFQEAAFVARKYLATACSPFFIVCTRRRISVMLNSVMVYK
jgi:hypothetical protein